MIVEDSGVDFWEIEFDFDALLVTTNGVVKNDGRLVMGAGIARQFARQYPMLPRTFGDWVRKVGNVPCCAHIDTDRAIISMPTKHHFKDKSDIQLIADSAMEVAKIVNHWGYARVLAAAPGCGMGGLKWEQVRPILHDIWDDRFTVLKPEG